MARSMFPEAALPPSELSYDSCVPRTLVHKRAVSEVFVTDAVRQGPGRFAIAAQWPRDHVFFQPGAEGTSDPLLWIETVRQAGIYLSHRFYDVPLNHPFVLASLDFSLEDAQPPTHVPAPHAVRLDTTCDVKAQDARRLSMALEAVVSVDGRTRGRVGLTWQAVDPRRYDVLRRRNSPPSENADAPAIAGAVALPPEAVGRRYDRDVTLASALGTARAWNLRLDPGHPVLFDHACDHIPGMALLESFCQASALTSVGSGGPAPRVWTLQSGSVHFTCFGEPDLPVVITARPEPAAPGRPGTRGSRVAAIQGDRPLASAVLHGTLMRPESIARGGAA
ncbi:ScbA/BarX family gamma-butyrolactone biosynthesis protein [Streptomyces sp. NPDC048109]|uniref:ScbA/BarX family gamma-butyrolactone biosynthesis protein n=1 Tax=Streptomyces sp. NPDC048109 TaxID=3155482 RepID=UPI00341F4672